MPHHEPPAVTAYLSCDLCCLILVRYGVSEWENLPFQKKNYEDTLESMELLLFLGHQSENVSFFNNKVLFYFFLIEAGQHAGFHQNYLWEKFLLTGGKGLLGLQLPLRYVEPDERSKHLVASSTDTVPFFMCSGSAALEKASVAPSPGVLWMYLLVWLSWQKTFPLLRPSSTSSTALPCLQC